MLRGFWLAVVASVLTVLWGLWYLNNRGFTRDWREGLERELAKRGVAVTVGRLNLNPWRGLIVRKVQIKDSPDGHTVATVDEAVLDLNYANLLQGQPFLNAIDLRDAAVSLPADPKQPKGTRIQASGITTRVLLPPHQLYLVQAQGRILGVNINASGRLLNPEKLRSDDDPDSPHPLRSGLPEILHRIEALKLSGETPTLEVQFNGDLEHASQIDVRATLRTGPFNIRQSYAVRSAQLTASYTEGALRLEQCAITDALGTLDAAGSYDPATGKAALQLRSTLDLGGLVHALRLGPEWDEFVFYTPPQVDLNGACELHEEGPGFRGTLIGHLQTGRFSVKSNIFHEAAADFSWDGTRWYLSNARVSHATGEARLNAIRASDGYRFRAESTLNPSVLRPFFPGEAGARIGEIDCKESPRIRIEGSSRSLSLDTLEAHGTLSLGATRIRACDFLGIQADLALRGQTLEASNVVIRRAEGTGTGALSYDFARDQLTLKNVQSTLNPVEFISCFNAPLAQTLTPYRFKKRPEVTLNGLIDCRHNQMERNQLAIRIAAPEGMDYTLIRKNLSFGSAKGDLAIVRDRLKITGLEGTLFSGTATADIDLSLRKSEGDYRASVRTAGVDFASLTKLYFDYGSSTGKLDGSFTFTGKHDEAKAIEGTGELTVSDGNVFAIPIFGPVSGILSELLPGVAYNIARKGTCTFTMSKGVFETDDLEIAGKGFSIFGKGKLFLTEDKMDFTIRINAQGATGVLLNPVSKLLEFQADDTLSKPNWHPKRLPKSFFSTPKPAATIPH